MINTIKEWIWGKTPVLWFPDERNYVVVECKEMPSCVGMEIKGIPDVKSRFKVEKDKEFRTIKPTQITETSTGFIAETGKLTIIFEEKK